jgi:pimeloyl-ACP methyl ester carboxylesterase
MTRPCVVLLPGLMCDAAVWSAQCEALSFADCVLPSYGELSSITGMARHVLESAPAQRFSLAGHSMGGRVALEVARLAPQRVERLALLDTGMDPLAPGDAGRRERDKRMALLQLAREQGMRAMGREWARGMVHPSRLGSPLFEQVLDMIERQTPAIFEAQITALLGRPDARGVLRGLQCPTLLACGRQDAWSPLSRHEEMHALVPGSRLVVIEDSGHMCTMEQPAAVSRALQAWLRGG